MALYWLVILFCYSILMFCSFYSDALLIQYYDIQLFNAMMIMKSLFCYYIRWCWKKSEDTMKQYYCWYSNGKWWYWWPEEGRKTLLPTHSTDWPDTPPAWYPWWLPDGILMMMISDPDQWRWPWKPVPSHRWLPTVLIVLKK